MLATLLACLSVPPVAHADDLSFAKGPGSPFELPGFPRDNVVADFDADGHGDVVVGKIQANDPIRVFWGGPDGAVAQTTNVGDPAPAEHIAVGRLDADADLDFAICGTEVVPFYKDDNARTFTPGVGIQVNTGGKSYNTCNGLAIADFDQDDDRDIAFAAEERNSATTSPAQLRILVNNGSPSFPSFTIGDESVVEDYVGEVVVGKFNTDDDPDIAYSYIDATINAPSEYGVQVMLATAGANFNDGQEIVTGPSDSGDLVAAKLDGDAYDDLLVDGSAVVRWAAGDGTFPTSLTVSDDFYTDLRVGNMTNDTALDVVAVGKPTRVFVNSGSRTFSLGHELAFPDTAFAVNANVGDLDADPRDDLALTVDIDDDFDDELFKLLTRDPGQPNPFGATTPPPDDDGDPPGPGPGPPAPPGGSPPPQPGPPMVVPPGGTPGTVIPVRANQIATLPSNRRCVSRRNFKIRLRRPPEGIAVREARVLVNGKRVKVVRGARLTAPVDLRGLPKGKVVVTIRITLVDGRVLRGKRDYRTCATKKRGSKRFPRSRG